MPFALDNGAFIAWRDEQPWDYEGWKDFLAYVRMTGQKPLWTAVPDAVGDKDKTLNNWDKYAADIPCDWPKAFCVQDGMIFSDVPANADVIFVGGTDRWKFPNLEHWTTHFLKVHCARVNSPQMIEACERLGCESVDGTGWFLEPSRNDKLPALKRFVEGFRECDTTLSLLLYKKSNRDT